MKDLNCFLCWLLIVVSSHAASLETLPTHHWAYDYIEYIQNRGCLLELNPLQLPYTRSQIAQQLCHEKKKIESLSSPIITEIYLKLKDEFSREITVKDSDYLIGRSRLQANLDKEWKADAAYRGVYRGGAGAQIGEHVFAFSGVNFDQYDYHNPKYKGDKWRGITAYTEQAYVRVNWDRFDLLIGRDFLSWGPGESGTLVLSNLARPLDQVRARATLGPFDYMFFASELDRMKGFDRDSSQVTARRYISGHRLGVRLLDNRFRIAVSELMVYGGPNESFNTVYLNPVLFYHGAQKNEAGAGNVLPTVDILFYPKTSIQIYASLLIDDIQIENKVTDDLEPDEIGVITGLKWLEPFGLAGVSLSGEYVRVTNRTYKALQFYEVFLHRNEPLGHPLGNDFDLLQLQANQWIGDFRFELVYNKTRRGEGSLYTPFDTPWRAFSIDDGYSEPFPTGVVETADTIIISARYQPSVHWGMNAELSYSSNDNYKNVKGANENHTMWRLCFWWDGELLFGFK